MTRRANDSSDPSNDSVLALTEGERRFLATLVELGVPFLVVGVGSAALQGARVVTEDIDLWFKDRSDRRIGDAAARFGGVFVAGHFGMMPPQIGGGTVGDRLDIVLSPQGLDSFDTEYARSREVDIDGVVVRVLPLERVIASKRAADRAKDRAVLPALEAALAVERDEAANPIPDPAKS
jgi:hypothetical protein